MVPRHLLSLFVTFHESRYANTVDQHVKCEFRDIKDLIKCLRQYSRTVIDKKEDGLWMNAATFQSFFMPCTNRNHPDWRFFAVYGNEHKDDLVRLAIDPSEYAKTFKANYEKERGVRSFGEPPLVADSSRGAIEEIIAPLRLMTEGRRRPIFNAANQLAKSGLNAIQIESELLAVVGEVSHLRRHVKESIKSLKRYCGLC